MRGDGRGDEEGFGEMNVSKTDATSHRCHGTENDL